MVKYSKGYFSIPPCENIASLAVRYIASRDFITTVVCAVNNEYELDQLIDAGSAEYNGNDELVLNSYNKAQTFEQGIPLFISALYGDPANIRMKFHAASNLGECLNVAMPEIPMNAPGFEELLSQFCGKLALEAQKQGYGRYLRK